MEPFIFYQQLLVGVAAVILHSAVCQAAPVVRREAVCPVSAPSAVNPQYLIPDWQIPGDCSFSVMETSTTHCLWCEQQTVTTVLSNATYCCPAFRYCTEENQQGIQCDGFWDTSEEFQKLADYQDAFQANLINISETTKYHFEEISALATVVTELPGILAKLNKTTETVSMLLNILDKINATSARQ